MCSADLIAPDLSTVNPDFDPRMLAARSFGTAKHAAALVGVDAQPASMNAAATPAQIVFIGQE